MREREGGWVLCQFVMIEHKDVGRSSRAELLFALKFDDGSDENVRHPYICVQKISDRWLSHDVWCCFRLLLVFNDLEMKTKESKSRSRARARAGRRTCKLLTLKFLIESPIHARHKLLLLFVRFGIASNPYRRLFFCSCSLAARFYDAYFWCVKCDGKIACVTVTDTTSTKKVAFFASSIHSIIADQMMRIALRMTNIQEIDLVFSVIRADRRRTQAHTHRVVPMTLIWSEEKE